MDTLTGIGRFLIILGLFVVGIGLLLTFGAKIPWIGRLPGDIYIKRDNLIFYFPITTSILVSILLTLLLYLFFRR